MLSDGELLRRYAEEGSQPAFTELVQRHGNLVYRAALRRVGGNAHTADDVTQKVFADLARKAPGLVRHANVAGWLYQGTRFAAGDAVRAERRRGVREAEARKMNEETAAAPVVWTRFEPWLDETMDHLPEQDRSAILLHYFEGRTFPEIGGLLAISADAARMRVNRGLERLRVLLGKRGITSTAAALSEALLTQSATAAGMPPVQALTAAALRQATVQVTGGGSILVRWLAVARSAPAMPVMAVVAILGGWAEWRFHAGDPVQLPPTAVNAKDPVYTAEEAPEAPAPDDREASVLAGVPAQGTKFVALPVPEKRILKILWSREQTFGTEPGKHWGVTVLPDAPNYPDFLRARRALRLRGLVAVGRQKGSAFLTEDGFAFCVEQRAEIDAFPMPKTKRGL